MQDAVPDKSIPYYNVIMRCDHFRSTPAVELPPGYSLAMYADGNERDWAALEFEIGDFPSFDEALLYFETKYLYEKRDLYERCLFIRNPGGEAIASCMAWRDERQGQTVASLNWLVVKPKYQGLGFGKAALLETLRIFRHKNKQPVYLHTQPWSYKAISLYHKYGFSLLKTDTFAGYVNQYAEAMEVLKPLYTLEKYRKLTESAR